MRQKDTGETAETKSVITLPNREEMEALLLQADDRVSLRRRLYPLLLEHLAGKTLSHGEVIMTLILAIEAFAGKEGIKSQRIHDNAPSFIDALVVDPKVAAELKILYPTTLEGMDKLEWMLKNIDK